MCFRNLPIVFDADGRARLDAARGWEPDGERPVPQPPQAARPPPGRTVAFTVDPVTRVAGALAFHARVDLDNRVVDAAYSEAVMFRGYELILQGRHPADAIEISSRACGVCGGVHSTCAAMALEMTFGAVPPPLAIVARNLAEAAELLYDHCLHLFLLAGPDYSEAMVRQTEPRLWRRAEDTSARHADVHGRARIADLMRDLNPLQGALALEALEVTRWGREVVSLIYGKYPHPSVIVPAGLTVQFDSAKLNQVLARALRLVDFAKLAEAVWDDLVEFFYEADPAYGQVGRRPTSFITTGIWDDPERYTARYEDADEWGALRLCPPGVVVDGELRTTRLRQIDLGVEEFVTHSYYDHWTREQPLATPDGAPLSPYHPWNRRTVARPEERSWRERYSWATAPRWDRVPMESGPLARQWVAAMTGSVQTDFIASGGGRLEILVPRGEAPERTLHWEAPEVCNALERNRARAVHVAYCLMVAYDFVLRGLDYLRVGEDRMTAPVEVRDGVGVGFWEAGRGALTHHCVVEGGKLANYQILTPSTWMASPRDPWDVPGPYEEAVANTPVLEEVRDEDDFVGIDLLRAIRSFDPCLPCAVHMETPTGVVVRDATSCACGT